MAIWPADTNSKMLDPEAVTRFGFDEKIELAALLPHRIRP
jgi:hypothetical protein